MPLGTSVPRSDLGLRAGQPISEIIPDLPGAVEKLVHLRNARPERPRHNFGVGSALRVNPLPRTHQPDYQRHVRRVEIRLRGEPHPFLGLVGFGLDGERDQVPDDRARGRIEAARLL